MREPGNTVLVTGGGSGIGLALARRLHEAGNRVIVTGRRMVVLQETAEGSAGIAAPALNVLVNNAGVMRRENLRFRRDLTDADETIATNLLGPIRLTNALVEHLARQDGAAIINVTSGLAFVPMPSSPSYSASKPRWTGTPSAFGSSCAGRCRSSSSTRRRRRSASLEGPA